MNRIGGGQSQPVPQCPRKPLPILHTVAESASETKSSVEGYNEIHISCNPYHACLGMSDTSHFGENFSIDRYRLQPYACISVFAWAKRLLSVTGFIDDSKLSALELASKPFAFQPPGRTLHVRSTVARVERNSQPTHSRGQEVTHSAARKHMPLALSIEKHGCFKQNKTTLSPVYSTVNT